MVTSTPYRFDTSRIPTQRAFMESSVKELLFSGAFGASKSRVGCEKGHFLSLKYPGNSGAILRKTFVSLGKTTMQTWFRDVCPPEHIASFNQVTNICKLTNGSQVMFLGMDDPQKLGSLEIGWAFIDEAVETDEDDYMMLLGRLRLASVPFRQIFSATNPGAPTHYLYRRFFLEKSPNRQVFESSSLDNPYLPQDYIEHLLTFTGIYKERFVLGKWVGFEGIVYDNFNPQTHIVVPFPIPEDWPRYRVVDFGYTNPFVCQWWAEAKADAIDHGYKGFYLYREIYFSHRSVPDHALTIREYREPIVATFADWDSGDRAILEQNGIGTIAARKDINLGIQETYEAIANGRVHILQNSLVELDESLVEARRPTRTSEEVAVYHWQKSLDRMPKNVKEVPADKDNHGMDGLRYLIYTLSRRSDGGQVIYARRNTQSPVSAPARRWERPVRSWRGQ